MLYYDRINISQGIDRTKSNESISRFCMQWLSWLNVNINNITIITNKNVDYRYIIHKISKSEAINLSKNSVLEGRWHI